MGDSSPVAKHTPTARHPDRRPRGERGQRRTKARKINSSTNTVKPILQFMFPSSPGLAARLARRQLIQQLAAGLGIAISGSAWAQFLGRSPQQLPADRSVFELRGAVMANGKPLTETSVIRIGDTLTTGTNAELSFAVDGDAFLLRERSTFEIGVTSAGKRFFRLVNGAVLSVFGTQPEPFAVHSPHVFLGVRGTGLYLQVEAQSTYVCVCYGSVRIAVADQPTLFEDAVSQHHDMPRRVFVGGGTPGRIEPAAFINHTDTELRLLEALVGRTVPFGLLPDPYRNSRRDY